MDWLANLWVWWLLAALVAQALVAVAAWRRERRRARRDDSAPVPKISPRAESIPEPPAPWPPTGRARSSRPPRASSRLPGRHQSQ
jgi:hypothetical protein